VRVVKTGEISDGAILLVEEDGSVRLLIPISGAGGGGSGSGGGQTSSGTTSTVDPWQSKINELAYGQISKGVETTGGLPAYLEANPYALPNAAESAIVGQIGQEAGAWGPLTEQEQLGLSEYGQLGDPSFALQQAQDLYQKYAAPIVRNDATVRGQGRQGVVPESLATGFAQMALPIIQGSNAAREALAGRRLGLGPELLQRRLTGQETALRAAGAERQAVSAEYMRPLSAIANIVGGLPMGGGATQGYQTGQVSKDQPDFNALQDLLVPVLSSLAAGYARG